MVKRTRPIKSKTKTTYEKAGLLAGAKAAAEATQRERIAVFMISSTR